MTSTPDIDAARAELTAAEEAVDRLRSRLRAALADQASRGESAADADADSAPRRMGWADGVAAARARYPQGNGTGVAPGTDADADPGQHAAAGRAEARRRAARRV